MWLEELVWLWGPLVGGAGLWGVWSLISLKTEVRALQQRLAQLESDKPQRRDGVQKAA